MVRFTENSPDKYRERYQKWNDEHNNWTDDQKNNGKPYETGKDPMTFLNNEVMAKEYLKDETDKKAEIAGPADYKFGDGKWTVEAVPPSPPSSTA